MWLVEPVLLASGSGEVTRIVISPDDDVDLAVGTDGVGDVGGERHVAAGVRRDELAVREDPGVAVDGTEVQQHPTSAAGVVDPNYAPIPASFH